MPRFLLRRVGLGLFVMLAVTVIVFAIFFVGPGPQYVAQRLAGRPASHEIVSAVRHRLLLDKPTYLQYWHFIKQLVWHHDLGYSYYHGQPVTSVLKEAIPITFSLAAGASVLWLVIGVLSGILSAVKRGSIADRVVTI